MVIKSLNVNGLFGYINKSIEFDEELTILVGINGSGKTTILQIIEWLFTPSISKLSSIEFKTLDLVFIINDIEYKIHCEHSDSVFSYILNEDDERIGSIINFKEKSFEETIEEINIKEFIKNTLNKNNDLIEIIESFKVPIFIDIKRNTSLRNINRNTSVEKKSRDYDLGYESSGYDDLFFLDTELTPIEYGKFLITKNHQILLNKFRNSLEEAIFNLIKMNFESLEIQTEPPQDSELDEIIDNSRNLFSQDIFNSVDTFPLVDYFIDNHILEIKSQLKTYKFLLSNGSIPKEFFSYFGVALKVAQLKKINEIAKQLEKDYYLIFENFHEYLETLNLFFADTKKEIDITRISEIYITILNQEKFSKNSTISDFNLLSSGEQQLFLLFTFISFSNDGGVFLIDEPEISLHVLWQENLIPQLKKLNNTKNQLIIATHSPILVGQYPEKVRLL